MPEGLITTDDIERMKRGFELYNTGEFDAVRDFLSPDVVVERVGNLPPISGWEAFRQLQEPDAFEWQRIHPLSWEINGDKVLLHVRIHAKGAGSGVELDIDGWIVFTVADGLVVRVQNLRDEREAREAAGL